MNKHRQRKIGRVVSTQMQSTVVVSVDTLMSHPLYRKKIRKTKRFLAHDPQSTASMGDTVTIEETRPISKLKRWLVVNVKKTENLVDVSTVEEALS
ncbi:30S ribosomal protein S17 [Patescibacteria group bacterium]|nr:30S ribosomal protein S17 [Patescibacteria group bacterium]